MQGRKWAAAALAGAAMLMLGATQLALAEGAEATAGPLVLPVLGAAMLGLGIGWLARQARAARPSADEEARRLAELSHALRTPLNSVIGFSEIMREEMLGPLGNPRYRDYAGHIKDDAQRILARVDDLVQARGA